MYKYCKCADSKSTTIFMERETAFMKKMKSFLLLMTCTFVLLGTTACGSRDNADNGADQSTTDRTDTEDNDDRTMNDATEGDGILDDAVA